MQCRGQRRAGPWSRARPAAARKSPPAPIHYGSGRRADPFVPVNCGALAASLIESGLFGVERGASTDRRRSRRGLVAEAGAGTRTLFLDEVDALTPKAQVTLLRFLQDQCYRAVGTTREQRTDVPLIPAANRPLAGLVERDLFRADLPYRLKVLTLTLPPLRERDADVVLLAGHFIAVFSARHGVPVKRIRSDAQQWMASYGWPGNVGPRTGSTASS